MAETRFFTRQPRLSQIVLTFGLHQSTPSSLNLPQSDPPPVDLSVRDIRSQTAAEWSEIAQWSQWRDYRKPTSLFRMIPSLIPYDLAFTQNGVPDAPPTTNFVTSAATW